MKAFMAGCLVFISAVYGSLGLELPSIIGDHMVIQQGRPFKCWGWAEPGENVTVRLGTATAIAKTDADGQWETEVLLEAQAGDTLSMTVQSGREQIELQDLRVGEVWICSGQSNMEWPVIMSEDGQRHRVEATNRLIRLFELHDAKSFDPTNRMEGTWKVCSKDSVPNFSAVGYFFGQRLQQELDTPVGLLDICVGGTPAEAWTSRRGLEEVPVLQPIVDRLDRLLIQTNNEADMESYRKAMAAWKDDHYITDESNEGVALGWQSSDDKPAWGVMELPNHIERAGLDMNGVIWFRKHISIPEHWQGQELLLSLGPIDDCDITYVNGIPVGETSGNLSENWRTPRRYRVPAELTDQETLHLAVRVFDQQGGGGIYGAKSEMFLALPDESEKRGISGEWKYRIERAVAALTSEELATRPVPPGGRNWHGVPTVLYNAMIHPVVNLPVRGAIWYQGEANVGRHKEYTYLLPAMINDWRSRWGDTFPFYIVQLANYGERHQDNYAWLREAQQQVADRLEACELTTAVDIGNPRDIHPRNKLDVGQRLAGLALKYTYGYEELPADCPRVTAVKRTQQGWLLTVEHTAEGLLLDDTEQSGFEVEVSPGMYVPAAVEIKDGKLLITAAVPDASSVRYGWSNDPYLSVRNSEGLPLLPFLLEMP